MAQFFDPLLIMSLDAQLRRPWGEQDPRRHQRGGGPGDLARDARAFRTPGDRARGILLVVVTIILKGFVIPRFLVHAMREANIQHEVNPVVGYMSSLLLGAVGTGLAMVFSYTLPLAEEHQHLLLVPASLSTVWTGFLLLTTRRKAIMQVLGYLLLENGIFLFGLLLLEAMPFLVEAGVLLDLFTGVFVMGDHHSSYQPLVHIDQHRAPVGVEGINDDLHADPVPTGDGGGDVRYAFGPLAAVALTIGGPGTPCPGPFGDPRPADGPPSRDWEAGSCSIRWESSSWAFRAFSFSFAPFMRRAISPFAPTGPTVSSAPTCS